MIAALRRSRLVQPELDAPECRRLPRDVWRDTPWFEPYDGPPRPPVVGQSRSDQPIPPSLVDLPAPFLAICPAKPPSNRSQSVRGSSVDTVVEETQDEALHSFLPRDAPEPSLAPTDDYDPQAFTASELMLSLRHGTSFSTLSRDTTASSSCARSTDSGVLLRHKHDSPFSATRALATTLAPASSSTTLTIPSVVESVQPLPSLSQTSTRSELRTISSHASFSALPPPPPLPFAPDQPSSSQLAQPDGLGRFGKRSYDFHSASSSSQELDPNLTTLANPARNKPRVLSPPLSPPPPREVRGDPAPTTSSSPPPFDSSFPFSITQSSAASSARDPDDLRTSSPPPQSGRDEAELVGESQGTVTTEFDESQDTGDGRDGGRFEDSQESVEY